MFVSHKLSSIVCCAAAAAGLTLAFAQTGLGPFPTPNRINVNLLSSGAKAYVLGPNTGHSTSMSARLSPIFGNNVDAANPNEDLASGQSETAIAAHGSNVMAAWNDATGFLVLSGRKSSLTGVGLSRNGGHSFVDLMGLPNANAHQRWSGDPSVQAIDATHFVISSIYAPACVLGVGGQFAIAVSVATIGSTSVSFTQPIIAATGGGPPCTPVPPPADLALLDKPWISYDPSTRTLSLSFTRFFFFYPHFGTGQIELVRAHVPSDPTTLDTGDFTAPIVIWPEEPNVVNAGSYVAVDKAGDSYVAWERNWQSNFFNGDPYVYIQAALVPKGASSPAVGGPGNPVVVTTGQLNSSRRGGVKSLDSVVIAGYNRGIGQDFPRIAVDNLNGRVIVEWNDASRHPLGDIWLRSLSLSLALTGSIHQVNDDSDFTLHFLPAVSVRSDGSIASSWYDRRLGGPSSTLTDYWGEIRSAPDVNGADFRISTASTDWNGTSSFITPNFGDYTDNASFGTTTYFNWSDGRMGVPQPFVSSVIW